MHPTIWLENSKTDDATAACPICESVLPRKEFALIQKEPAIGLLKCKSCKAASVSRNPKPEVLDQYYAQYRYDGGQDNSQVTFQGASRFAKHLMKMLEKNITVGNSLRILDFGGGDGALAIALSKLFKNVEIVITVVDYERVSSDQELPHNVSIRHIRELEKATDLNDIVLASAVMEHIPKPGKVFKDLVDRTKVGGCIYVRTPFIGPQMKLLHCIDKLLGSSLSTKRGFGFPAHMHDMGPAFWIQVGDSLGLPVKTIISQPSIPQLQLSTRFLRALASYAFKLPAYIEVRLGHKIPWWGFSGGWEAVLLKQ